MAAIERALESLANRGESRGADKLIARLEAELQAAPPRPITRQRERRPVGWKWGPVFAVATALVIGIVIVLGALLVRLLVDDETTPPATVPTTVVRSTEPPSPEALFDGMAGLQGNDVGVFEGGAFVPLTSVETGVTTVLGDLAGGAVFQSNDAAVLLAAPDDAVTTLLRADPGERVSLEDVAVIDGERIAVVLRSDLEDPGGGFAVLAVSLASGDVRELMELAGPDSVDRVTIGGDVFLITYADGDATRFEFRSASGSVLADTINPRPAPSSSLVSQGVLSADGTTMVYIDRALEDAGGGLADFVTFDLVAGVELQRLPLANLQDRIIEFDGDRLLIARRSSTAEEPTVIVGLHLSEGARLTSEGSFSIELLSPR